MWRKIGFPHDLKVVINNHLYLYSSLILTMKLNEGLLSQNNNHTKTIIMPPKMILNIKCITHNLKLDYMNNALKYART